MASTVYLLFRKLNWFSETVSTNHVTYSVVVVESFPPEASLSNTGFKGFQEDFGSYRDHFFEDFVRHLVDPRNRLGIKPPTRSL